MESALCIPNDGLIFYTDDHYGKFRGTYERGCLPDLCHCEQLGVTKSILTNSCGAINTTLNGKRFLKRTQSIWIAPLLFRTKLVE